MFALAFQLRHWVAIWKPLHRIPLSVHSTASGGLLCTVDWMDKDSNRLHPLSAASCLLSVHFLPQGVVCCQAASSTLILDVMPFSCYISSQRRENWWEMCCHPPVIVDVLLFWSTFHLAFYSFWPDYHFTKKTETKIKTKRFQLPSGLIYCWGPKCPSLLWWSMWLCRKKDAFLAICLTQLLVCVSALLS